MLDNLGKDTDVSKALVSIEILSAVQMQEFKQVGVWDTI